MSIWLSVVMPVHGGATYLGATLESAAAEVAGDAGVEFRLYNSLADDGAARAIADGFTGRLNMVWQDVPQLGPWTAKTNLGVAEARGTHIAMLHQDDLWLPGHLAALRAARDAGGVMSVAPSRFVGPAGQDLGLWGLPFAPGVHAGADFARTLLVQNTIAIPSPLIAREAWAACGGLADALWYTADWDLYLKLARAGEVYVRAAATTAFRVHAKSLTMTGSRDAAAFRAQHEQVLARHLPDLAPLPQGLERRARAGIAVNCALAAAANGQRAGLMGAAGRVCTLGPMGALRFIRESRLIDRIRPRLRLMLSGGM